MEIDKSKVNDKKTLASTWKILLKEVEDLSYKLQSEVERGDDVYEIAISVIFMRAIPPVAILFLKDMAKNEPVNMKELFKLCVDEWEFLSGYIQGTLERNAGRIGKQINAKFEIEAMKNEKNKYSN